MIEVGTKYTERNLRYMRQLYEMIQETKWNTMCSKLCWSHYREVLSLKNVNEIIYYLNECENKNLTQRQLHELVKNNIYNRLSKETKTILIESKELKVNDLIPNPITIKYDLLKDDLSEYVLKQAILNNIDDFLKQLGIGFTYVGNEYKIKIGDRYNYIDLLLFNIKYNCYIVVELKVTEFKAEYISQVLKYMNYIDKKLKEASNNNTMGILICKRENKFVIEYCSDERITVREYDLV